MNQYRFVSFLRKEKLTFVLLLSIFIFFSGIILVYGYAGSYIFIQSFRSDFFDKIMPFLTEFGEGLNCGIIAGLLWYFNRAAATIGIQSVILSGLSVQLLKRTLFIEWDRPSVFFQENPNVTQLFTGAPGHYSFPSGHSATIFSAVLVWMLFLRKTSLKILLLLFASLVAWSRIYLGYHFPGDVLAGSFLGTAFTLFIWISHKVYMEDVFGRASARKKILVTDRIFTIVFLGGILLTLLRVF